MLSEHLKTLHIWFEAHRQTATKFTITEAEAFSHCLRSAADIAGMLEAQIVPPHARSQIQPLTLIQGGKGEGDAA